MLCARTGVSAAEFATWAVFLLGNCGLLKRAITRGDDARAKTGHSLDALTAIAVIFGLLWAWPVHWAIGSGELPQATTIMIGGGVVRELAAGSVATCIDHGELFNSDDGTTLRQRDGGIQRITFTVAPLCEGDTRVGAVLLVRDITDARDHAHARTARAAHDPLTSLCNRVEFESRLQRALETPTLGSAKPHALCVINLEHFTFINDTYGSAAGDRVRLSLAELLAHKIRGVDLLAHLDDAAFGLLLYNSPIDKARLIAEELCSLIDSFHCAWHDNVINVHACVGVVEVRPGQTTLTEALIAVDVACTTAMRARPSRPCAAGRRRGTPPESGACASQGTADGAPLRKCRALFSAVARDRRACARPGVLRTAAADEYPNRRAARAT